MATISRNVRYKTDNAKNVEETMKDEGRSFADVVNRIIEEHYKKKGKGKK